MMLRISGLRCGFVSSILKMKEEYKEAKRKHEKKYFRSTTMD